MKYFSIIILIFSFHLTICAGPGPAQIAKIDRKLWPYQIHSEAEFDFASKMEMLVFIDLFQAQEQKTNEDSLKKYLATEKISVESVKQWQNQTKAIFITNFQSLSSAKLPHDFIPISKPITWQGLVAVSEIQKNKMPAELKAWHSEAMKFYARYLYEQMRLAALFPRITSEILTLENSEITGSEMPDKQFLLTFDDGPTAANGNTDKLIRTLEKNRMTGIFFVLGDMYDARLKNSSIKSLHDLYGANVVGSHAKVHKPHQKYEEWEYSLSFTAHAIDSVVPENKKTHYFRPPYGQRNAKMIRYLGDYKTKVMLWNIDSQDWSSKITAPEMADRVCTLMLLWRKGILLFHDIHPKCNEALPMIWNYFEGSGIKWKDPKTLE